MTVIVKGTGGRSSFGLLVDDVRISYPGTETTFLDVQADSRNWVDGVKAFQTYAASKNLYPRDLIDGIWGKKSEGAFTALLPGVAGPTTTRMLGGLDSISPAVFRKARTLYGIACARDAWLKKVYGDVQVEPDINAREETADLVAGSDPWNPNDPAANRDPVGVGAAQTTDPYATERGDTLTVEGDEELDTGTRRNPHLAYVGWGVGVLVVGLAVTGIVMALRGPRRTRRRRRR